jgi:hypothetical protein
MAANEPPVSSEYTGQHASAGAPQQAAPEAPVAKTRRRLFTKYVALFVAVVCIALVSNGVFDVLFYYQEHKRSAKASGDEALRNPTTGIADCCARAASGHAAAAAKITVQGARYPEKARTDSAILIESYPDGGEIFTVNVM